MVLSIVPWCVHMVLPDLLFVFYYVLVYFVVEFCNVRMVGIDFSKLISIVNFGENVWWNGFISYVYISSGNVHFICL